jgi:predicted transcriptional regulator
MAEETKVTLEELMVTNLAMSDATAKLLIKKGVFTVEEFAARLGAERATYLAVLKRLH